MQYSTIQCNTVLYNAIQCNSLLYSTIQCTVKKQLVLLELWEQEEVSEIKSGEEKKERNPTKLFCTILFDTILYCREEIPQSTIAVRRCVKPIHSQKAT